MCLKLRCERLAREAGLVLVSFTINPSVRHYALVQDWSRHGLRAAACGMWFGRLADVHRYLEPSWVP